MANSNSSEGLNPIAIGFSIVLGILALIVFFGSWTTIPAGHRGVVMHWGKVQPQIMDEGLYFTCPFMTSVQKISVRVDKNQVKASAASKDMQTVNTDVAINWHINAEDVQHVFQTVGNEDTIVENILTPAVNEVFKASCSKLTAEDILERRIELKDDVDKSLSERLAKYNIVVDDISIVDIGFSDDFSKAIEAKQVAEQQAEQAKYTAEQAKQEAQAKINEAYGQAQAQKLIQSTLTKGVLQKMAYDKWNGVLPVVVGSGNLPFIMDLKDIRDTAPSPKAQSTDDNQ